MSTPLWLPKPFDEKYSNPVFDRFVANLKSELLRTDTDDESQRVVFENINPENVALCIDTSYDESDFSLRVLATVDVNVQ